jgi:hypothetical protein
MFELSVVYSNEIEHADHVLGKFAPSEILKAIELLNLYGYMDEWLNKHTVDYVEFDGEYVIVTLKQVQE